jgi:hypothetical protein
MKEQSDESRKGSAGASIPQNVLLAFQALARAQENGNVKIIRGMALAIVVGSGLLASGHAFALCNVPPSSGSPADPSGETGAAPVPDPIVRAPVNVPGYSPSSSTQGPGANAVGNGAGTASYANTQVVVAPTERAAADKAEWCRRSGRSQTSTDACLKAVINK